MRESLNSHIYPRASKANNKGLCPIYVRITIAGKRTEFSTKIYIDIKNWNYDYSRAKGKSIQANTLNSYLETIRLKIQQTYINLSILGVEININTFLQGFKGIKQKNRTLIPIFQNHNQKLKELIGNEYSTGTYSRYCITMGHIQKFLAWKYQIDDIDICKIDHAFINDFDFYLRTVHCCANNTVMKYIKNLKKITGICLANGWLDKDPFRNFKAKYIEIDKIYLDQLELDNIINKEISIDRIATVRDIFVFACYTGLAYIDVQKLSPQNINKDIEGNYWIYINRQKTNTLSRIPLLDITLELINKYNNHPKCINEGTLLPILSNQRMNAYLKEIADICGIHKTLTFHCARHTFATTVTLSNGVPIESVSKMLGHKNIKITQHYAKITDQKLANDMQNLKNKLLDNKKQIDNKDFG